MVAWMDDWPQLGPGGWRSIKTGQIMSKYKAQQDNIHDRYKHAIDVCLILVLDWSCDVAIMLATCCVKLKMSRETC